MYFSNLIFAVMLSSFAAANVKMIKLPAHLQAALNGGAVTTNPKVPGNSPLTYCEPDHSGDLLQLEYINLEPIPVAKGKNVTIYAAGRLDGDIEDGAYVKLQVKFGYIQLWNGVVDLCEQAGSVDEECPITKGDRLVEKKFEIPGNIPSGKYTVFADAYTKDDERITCLTADVTL